MKIAGTKGRMFLLSQIREGVHPDLSTTLHYLCTEKHKGIEIAILGQIRDLNAQHLLCVCGEQCMKKYIIMFLLFPRFPEAEPRVNELFHFR